MINRIPPVAVANRPASSRSAQPLLPDYRRSGTGESGRSREPWNVTVTEQVEDFIGKHPVLALTIGLTLGMFIGCLIKRR